MGPGHTKLLSFIFACCSYVSYVQYNYVNANLGNYLSCVIYLILISFLCRWLNLMKILLIKYNISSDIITAI